MAGQEFTLNVELPKYGVGEALRPHLIRYLINGGFSCGDPFLRDRDVVKATGRSRSAIRLAFDKLQEEGWIERRGGAGTFVGPKIKTVDTRKLEQTVLNKDPFGSELLDARQDSQEDVASCNVPQSQRLLRLAIVTSGFERSGFDNWWLAPQIRGINSLSEKYGVTLEFFGDQTASPQVLTRRFTEHRPDVLVSSGSLLNHMMVFGEAQRHQVPCILCAVRTPELDVPSIMDDAKTAVANSVQYLYDRGHRRIAYVSLKLPLWWTFDRHDGYEQGMEQCGLECDGDLTLWLPAEVNEASSMKLKKFIDKKEPTAIIFNCSVAASNMRWFTGRDGLYVGEDLSVIVYDQDPKIAGWFGGVNPTVINPPLYEMGQLIAKFARRIVEGQEIPLLSTLPCELIEGDSVKDLTVKG